MYPSHRRHNNHLSHHLQASSSFHPNMPPPQSWIPLPDSYLFSGAASSDLLTSLSRWSLGPPESLFSYPHGDPYHYKQQYVAPEAAPGFSPAPSDSSSVLSWDTVPSPAPAPEPLHVTCNAPLVAPVPLPFHSPFFLQYDDLPDIDEDLSHAPYTRRPPKRKRSFNDYSSQADGRDLDEFPAAKRRSVGGGEPFHLPPTAQALSMPAHLRTARRNSLPKGPTRHARPR